MREFQAKCQENPDFVFSPYADDEKKTPLKITIPNSNGAFVFEHNKPVLPATLIAPSIRRRNRNDMEYSMGELEATVFWLTGGEDGKQSHETDVYGVVHLPMEDASSTILEIASLTESDSEADNKKALAAYKELQKNLLDKTKNRMKIARELADYRVKEALKITHKNIIKQWETMQSEGMGRYSPSIAEAIGAHILSAEIDKAAKKQQEMVDRFQNVVKRTSVIPLG